MKTGRKWQIVATATVGVMLVSVWTGQARGDFVFGTPVNLGSLVNSSDSEYDPSVSADGLELYFQSSRAGGQGNSDLYVAQRPSVQDPWQAAVNLGPVVNSAAAESGPSLSSDGLTLYFNSNREGGSGGDDLYMTTRDSREEPWGKPVNLGPVVNSAFGDINPNISSDGLSLYFADVEGDSVAPRPGGVGSTDVWLSTRASLSDPWGPPVNLGAPVNSMTTDGSPEISSDGLLLFMNRWHNNSEAAFFDIWVATRATAQDPWGAPMNLGTSVNTNNWEGNAELSADGRTLYFISDRSGGQGSSDLWEASISPIVDFNGDGKVDEAEVRIMAKSLGQDDPRCDIGPTPFGDGVVDMKDVAVLTQYAAQEVQDPTLLACWKFDETGGVVACECTQASDGTLVGGPIWRPEEGAVGGAIQLDGVDDHVTTELVCNPSRKPISVFAWIKGGAAGQVIVSQRAGANWLSVDAATGALATELKNNTRFSCRLVSKAVITDGKWHRVGLVLDGVGRTLYVDGAVVAQDKQDHIIAAYGGLCIGTGKDLAAGSFWSGLVDDVRIYNRVVEP